MLERHLTVGPFQCNCHLLACPETGEALLVDPGDEPERLLKEVQSLKTPSGQPIRVKYLLHTHAHLDHIGGTRGLKEGLLKMKAVAPQIALHRADEFIYKVLKKQGEMFGIAHDDPLPIDHFLEHEEQLEVGRLKLSVIHTPGHSPGGVCFRLKEDSIHQIPERIFSGDTLFHRSVGRTDLWGGDMDTLLTSIRERLLTLDGDIPIFPGHGPSTTVADEKRKNPFLVG